MNKKIILTIIFISIVIILVGCWNYKEINDVSIVTGIAIDYDADKDLYIITTEIIKTAGSTQEERMSGTTFVSKGASIFDAIRNMIINTGKKLYWSDAAVVIVSQDIASQGIIPALDILIRGLEIRSDIWLLVSKEKTAGEILDTRTLKIHRIVSYHIEDIMKNENSISKYYGMPVWRFVKDLYSDGISPACPGIEIVNVNNTDILQVKDTCVFKGDRFVGWLDENETKYFLWVIGNLENGLFNLEFKEPDLPDKLSLEIVDSKTKKDAVYEDGNLIVKINIKVDATIAELSGNYDFSKPEKKSTLENLTAEQIKKDILIVIEKVQKEYKSDIFGFRALIKRKLPELWRGKIEPNWDYYYNSLNTQVNVKVTIKGSASTSKPIIVAD